MQTEELEDLEFDFEEGYGQKIEYLENAMIEATRNSDYDTFMEMWNRMKELCQNAGDGGKYYFSQFYEDDPRIKKLKQIVQMRPLIKLQIMNMMISHFLIAK